MNLAPALAAVLLVLTTSCGDTPQQKVDAAQASLNAGDFAAARTTAEEALSTEAVKADAQLTWRLEKLRLDALAASRQAPEILATLKRLQPTFGTKLDVPLYTTLAGKLSQAREHLGAIDVVQAGIEKFPEQKANFDGIINILKLAAEEAGKAGDNAALEKLSQLGYLSR